MTFDAHKNLAVTTIAVAPTPASSGTSCTVADGSVLPAVPYYGTITAAGEAPTLANSEIVRVTAGSGNTISAMTRGQGGTSARTVLVGDVFDAGLTSEMFTALETAIATETSARIAGDAAVAAGADAAGAAAAEAAARATAVSGEATARAAADALLAKVMIPTIVKTSAYSAAANEFVPVDASGGSVTVTLPTAPADKTIIVVKKIDASVNAVTIARGGSTDVFNKAGGSTSLTLSVTNQAMDLQYVAATGIWYLYADSLPLSGLDARYILASTVSVITPTTNGVPVWNGSAWVSQQIADAQVATGAAIDPLKINGTAVVTADSRLSNARTPTAHAASHAVAGSDPLTIEAAALASRPIYSVMPAGAVAETCPRRDCRSIISPPSGSVRLVAVMLPKGLVLTKLGMVSLGTALAGGTHQIFGVHDSSYNLLRSSTDDTSTAWAINSPKELNLTSTFTTTYEGLHYFSYLIAATTVPDLCGDNGPVNSGVYSMLPYTHFVGGTGATVLPNPAVFSAALDRTPYIYAK